MNQDALMTSGIVLCMTCGSSHVDVIAWQNGCAVTSCAACGGKGAMIGISIGRAQIGNVHIRQAQRDIALPKQAGIEERPQFLRSV